MFEELRPHLVELRKRLVICVLAVIVCFVIAFNFWEIILKFITHPLISVLPNGSEIIFTGVAEAFFTSMKVSFFASLLITLPIIFYQIWAFVAPGLYDNEKKYVIPFVLSATVMFFVGAAFCYFVVVPVAYKFLIGFGDQLFTAMPKINEYVGFFMKFMLAFGISFELPVVTFFLAKLGLVTNKSLSEFFRYAIVIIFIFAAVMTPPDILSQLLLAGPLVVLYAFSIFIAKLVNPYKEIDDINEEDENKEEKNE